MAKQIVPDTASFRLVHELTQGVGPTVEVINTIYVRNELVPWTTTSLSAMATTIGNGWRDEIMPELVDNLTFQRCEAEDLGADPGDQAVVNYGNAGGSLGDGASPSVCALAILDCASGAFPRKGHLFISGLDESDLSYAVVDNNLRTALQAGLNAIKASIEGGANAWVVVSRFLNKMKRAQGVTNTVEDIFIRDIVGSQRDRRE